MVRGLGRRQFGGAWNASCEFIAQNLHNSNFAKDILAYARCPMGATDCRVAHSLLDGGSQKFGYPSAEKRLSRSRFA